MDIIVGIDPGKTGAMVALDENGKHICHSYMPLIGNNLDSRELLSWINAIPGSIGDSDADIHIFIEDVHAIFGSSAGSTFAFGFICGGIQAVVATTYYPYTLVQPKIWQKVMYQGVPELRKPPAKFKNKAGKECTRKGSLKTKEMSLVAVKRLFPSVNLCRTTRCTKAHDGLVDALLIAEYGRRLLNV